MVGGGSEEGGEGGMGEGGWRRDGGKGRGGGDGPNGHQGTPLPIQERGAPGGREVPFPTHPGGVGGGELSEAKRAVRGVVRDSFSIMMMVR